MSTSSKPIICCGFTPCVQRIIEYSAFEKGTVNRARKVTVGIGGKGANTARMVKQLGRPSIVVGFVGGANGELLEKMLDAEEVGYRHVVVDGETRVCQTLVEEGNPETTELVEEMPPITPDNWDHMLKLFGSLELEDTVLPVSGKLPAGAPTDAYARICDLVHGQGGQVILDVQGEPLMRALEHEPFMVKINDHELFHATGETDVFVACRVLMERGAKSVLITRGSNTAFYMDPDLTYEIEPPIIKAINPVGSGDAVTAGISVAVSNGGDLENALVSGMACGAANALNLLSGCLKPADVKRLKGEVRTVRL